MSVEDMSRHDQITYWGQVRIESGDRVLQPDHDYVDLELHRKAGAKLLELLMEEAVDGRVQP